MKLIKFVKFKFYKILVSLDKKGIFYALRSVYKNSMVRRLSDSSNFSWQTMDIPTNPTNFEDLSGLFFCSPLNRGILRQDFDEAALLFKTITSMEKPQGVEIGRYNGGSTVLIATALGEGGLLYSIDISPKEDDISLKKILARYGWNNRVVLLKDDANNINLNLELDFVFIDGDHSYEGARKDHNKWGAMVKPGGYVIHHDMGNSRKYSVQWNDLRELLKDIIKNMSKNLFC